MTCTGYDKVRPEIGPVGEARQPSGFARQFSLIFEVFSAAFERWHNRRAIYKMLHLEDRYLHDIGLTRADLDWALSQPGHVDPSVALSDRIKRRRDARNWSRNFR